MKQRTTKITIETYEVLLRKLPNQGWCESCGKSVAAVSFDGVRDSGLSIEAVQRQAELGRIHLIETVGGSSLICLNSLIQI